MNDDLVKYEHGVSRIWVHISYKTKYAHNVFEEHEEVRKRCEELLIETAKSNNIEVDTIGFDSNHVHFISDLGLYSLPRFHKIFKGTLGKKLLEQFPEIKKKYFWGSGFWSRTKYCYSISRDKNQIENYVAKQKFFPKKLNKNQMTLLNFGS